MDVDIATAQALGDDCGSLLCPHRN